MSKILNVTVQLRNGTAAEWADTSVAGKGANRVLAKGELGIEIDTRLFKIGNGTDAYKDLQYANDFDVSKAQSSAYTITPTEGQTDQEAFNAWKAEAGNVANKGDIFIMKRLIAEGKYSYTGYVYDGTNLVAMDGNYSAENVYLADDITMAGNYTQVGNLTKTQTGTSTFSTKGKSVAEAFTEIFSKRLQPTITAQPAVSLTFSQAKAYEVGTVVTPTYSASLSAGSYTYGPATGITAQTWEVTNTAGGSATTATGTFDNVTVVDGISYTITAKATYNEGAVANDNLGSPSNPVIKIAAGSASKTSSAITGYRNTFYGTTTNKTALDSDTIRTLTKSGKALANGNKFTITIPVGAVRVVFAYPATLRDVTSVTDTNGLGAEVKSAFTMQKMVVKGAGSDAGIEYKVYTTEFASPVETANTYNVTI